MATDEDHLRAALGHIALDPVRARLTERAQDWPWSNVHAHLSGQDNGLTALEPVLRRYPTFADLIQRAPDGAAFGRLRRTETIGRPVGDERFMTALETLSAPSLRPAKPGAAHQDIDGLFNSLLSD